METRQEAFHLHDAMAADHARLECMFRDVLAILHGSDRDAVRSAWLALEAGLTSHINFEECSMLPAFEFGFPLEAAQIRREHRQIREALAQLGIDLELHELRADAAELFIKRLRKHATREDTLFYVWAEAHVSDDQQQSLVQRFRSWFAREDIGHPPKKGPVARPPGPRDHDGEKLVG